MKICKLIKILTLIQIFTITYFINAQDIQITSINPDHLSICGQDTMTVFIQNTTSSLFQNLTLNIELPTGIDYVQSSVRNAIEKNVTILSQPKFEIVLLNPGSKIGVQLIISSDCNAYDRLINGVSFQNKIILQYGTKTDSIVSNPPYNIVNALLIIPAVPDLNVDLGSNGLRQIKIINSRIGAINKFVFEDRHTQAAVITSNRSIIQENDYILQLELTGKDFLQIGDHDSLFEMDEMIIIDEWIQSKECKPNTVDSKFYANWGCNGRYCQMEDILSSSTTHFVESNKEAMLNFNPDGRAPKCICQEESTDQELVVRNMGKRNAENIEIEIRAKNSAQGGPVNRGFVKDSIRIIGNVKIDSIIFLEKDTLCSRDLYYSILVKLSKIDVGQEFKIVFEWESCESMLGTGRTDLVWYYSYRYSSQCLDGSLRQASEIPEVFPYFNSQSVSAYTATLGRSTQLYPDSVYKFVTNVQYPRNLTTQKLIVFLSLPCPLEITDSSFLLNLKKPSRIDIYRNINPGTQIRLLYDPPFRQEDSTIITCVKMSCDKECIDKGLINQKVKFKSSCEEPILITSRLSAEWCTSSQLTCPDQLGDCGTKQLFPHKLDLTFQCLKEENEIYQVPGYVDFEVNTQRVSIGILDRNNDRFMDSQNKADLSQIRLNRTITDDTICSLIGGKIIVDVPDYSFDSVSVLLTTILNLNVYETIVNWFDQSSGKTWKFKMNNLEPYLSVGKQLNCSYPILQQTELGDGWVLTLTPEIFNLIDPTYPNNQRFEEGDSLNITICSKVLSDVGFRILRTSLNFRILLFNRVNPKEHNFFCGTKSNPLELVTQCVKFVSSGLNDTICGSHFELPIQSIEILPHLKNFFPFEFRSWLKLDSLILGNLSSGLRMDSVEISVYYNDSVSKTLVRKLVLPLFLVGNQWKANLDSLSLLRFDEAYVMNLKFIGSISNCKLLPAIGTYRVDVSLYVSSDYSTPFYLSPLYITRNKSAVFSNTFNLVSSNSNSQLELANRTIVSNSRKIQLSTLLSGLENSGLFRIRLRSSKGLVKNFEIKAQPMITINKLSDVEFELGVFEKGKDYWLFFLGENMACDGDTLIIETIWACGAERIDSSNDCIKKVFFVPIIPRNAELELDYFPKIDKEVLLCDTLPEIELFLYNSNLGTAYDVVQELFIPDGVKIVSGSTRLAYPENASFIPIPPPLQISTTQFRYNYSDLIPAIKLNGLLGNDSMPKHGIRLKFKVFTECNSSINGFLNYLAAAKDLCNQKIYSPNRIGNQIRIKGLNSGASYNLNAILKLINKCSSNGNILVSINGSGLSQAGDSIKFFIPDPVEYVVGSFKVIKNIDLQNPDIEIVSGGKFVKIGLKSGVSLDQEIQFEIELKNFNIIPCGKVRIDLELITRQRTLCNISHLDCDVRVIKDQFNIQFDKESIVIHIDSFSLKESSNEKYITDIFLDIINASGLSDSLICFNLYQDSNINGKLDIDDVFIKEYCFVKELFQKDGKVKLTDSLANQLLNSCQFILTTSLNNCICNQDTTVLRLKELQAIRIVDSTDYCAGSNVEIGVDYKPNARYIWKSGKVSCDTCSKNTILIDDSLTVKTIFTYRLCEILPDQCNRTYEFNILAVPEVSGKKLIIEPCYGDTISIMSNQRKNIRWVGRNIKDPFSDSQKIFADSSQIIFLEFLDKPQCPGIDTFCILVKKFIGTLMVDPYESTINIGDSVELRVSNGVQWKWSPSLSLNCDTCQSVIAKPKQTTEYIIKVTDSLGCIHILKTIVKVIIADCDSSTIFIPNAFSPNDDGKNDVFRVRSSNIQSIILRVYDRWGEKVFESNDLNLGWDGIYKGEKLQPDVFGYYIEAKCPGDKKYFRKGNVSLLK
ncbi:MAG: gliding motility-associated C-terminal domain-containing protein [Saprospiraceae bacterium]|nr:gliding motility-associated C-terminal domain-containing protein [Saprospiraceae bacterium]